MFTMSRLHTKLCGGKGGTTIYYVKGLIAFSHREKLVKCNFSPNIWNIPKLPFCNKFYLEPVNAKENK